MEFQKHLVVSLETGEIEKWLTPELIEGEPIDVTVAPYVVPKKRVLKALLHRIFLTLLVSCGIPVYKWLCTIEYRSLPTTGASDDYHHHRNANDLP